MLKHRVLRAPVEEVSWSYLYPLAVCIQFLNGDDALGLGIRQSGAAILY